MKSCLYSNTCEKRGGSRTGQREQEDHNIGSDAKAFDCVDHKMWKILKEMGLPDHLTGLLRNLYAGQKATVIKTSLNIRKFTVHILLKPGLENFEHYFTNV